jgi:hypothetical protein
VSSECSTYEDEERCMQGWVRKAEEKKLRHIGRDNIKIGLQEIVWERGLDYSGSGSGHVAGSCEHYNIHSFSIKREEVCD